MNKYIYIGDRGIMVQGESWRVPLVHHYAGGVISPLKMIGGHH